MSSCVRSELCASAAFFFSAGATSCGGATSACAATRRAPQKRPVGDGEKGELRQAGNQAHGRRDQAGQIERAGLGQQLLANLAAQHAGGVGAGQRDAAGDRDQQRRNQRDQAVADGEHRVGARGLGQRHALLQGADQQAGDDVDAGNQDGGQRVALVEARRAVHGAVELGLAGDGLAAFARLLLVDQAGVHVGVDGHLLAGQRVEGEAGGDLGGAHGSVRNH